MYKLYKRCPSCEMISAHTKQINRSPLCPFFNSPDRFVEYCKYYDDGDIEMITKEEFEKLSK